MKKKFKHYAVIGRIPEDDEDSCLFFKATSPAQAKRYFDMEIYRVRFGTTRDRTRERQLARKGYGVTVFIAIIISSRSKFTLEKP